MRENQLNCSHIRDLSRTTVRSTMMEAADFYLPIVILDQRSFCVRSFCKRSILPRVYGIRE